MKLNKKFGFHRLACTAMYVICFAMLASCFPIDNRIVLATATSTVEVQVSTELPLPETRTPECMATPGVEIKAAPISANGVTVKVMGLIPHEPVSIILYSEFHGRTKSIGCCSGETANGDGNYEFTTGLRSQYVDAEFKDWQVQVVHSRGVACASFTLP